MDDVVYQRTKEQRDFWKEYAETVIKQNAKLIVEVRQLREGIKVLSSTPSGGADAAG